jgi:regulator of RNase E activity RraA
LGERDVVLSFAGVIITPGAIIYADRDGWLVSDQPL